MIARKEIRDERNDVLGFYNIVKKINDTQDGIIEVEEQFKETTLVALHDEMTAKLRFKSTPLALHLAVKIFSSV